MIKPLCPSPALAELGQNPIRGKPWRWLGSSCSRTITAPFPVLWPLYYGRSQRIQDHVATEFKKVAFFINKNGFVPPLENMTCPCISPVIFLGVNAVELSHPTRKVSFRSFQNEVVMVIHEAPGMAEPMESLDYKTEQIEEVFSIFVDFEYALPLEVT